ncbi:hypothetical protein PV08_07039 [Exophiala spinifera]|uniref:Uncharacterized protein n=1 Tax=Exophiala spinifera TaxID=91928 RepID=A0A0D1ZN32_9EURO|nr:uncharacterized protein PV08_07039 [Exophiala spinifera]KIW14257.1 hypothetical protein PV08_07039 [Exophiala spinifera]
MEISFILNDHVKANDNHNENKNKEDEENQAEEEAERQTLSQPRSTPRDNDSEQHTPRGLRYTEEEQLFLWYHHVDLYLDWDETLTQYRLQFPDKVRNQSSLSFCFDRLRRHNFHGIRGRQGVRGGRSRPMHRCIGRRFAWMRPEHR